MVAFSGGEQYDTTYDLLLAVLALIVGWFTDGFSRWGGVFGHNWAKIELSGS